MNLANGCWMDRLAPGDLADLDEFSKMMLLDEVHRLRAREATAECAHLMTLTIIACAVARPPTSAANDQRAEEARLTAVARAAFDVTLADRVADRIFEKLSHMRPSSETYTSSKLGPNPPGKSRNWAVRNIKNMPGAQKVGRDWTIAREDYERWHTDDDLERCQAAAKKRTSVAVTPNIRAIAEAALAGGGMRPTLK